MDPKANVIELAAYKRVAASYDSVAQLSAYLEAVGLSGRPGAARLLEQAENPSFWDKVAAPVLPFSRRDQKEFGDIKDASATTMLGLELTADARTESVAQDMVDLLAGYYINAVVRERIRAWTLAGKVDAQSQEKGVRADILRAQLDIELYGRRADDMKAMLARYPDAARMDSRQVVSVNPSEGGERYLSPLAQLVGAESAISQRRELIRRWQRELKQKTVLAQFYSSADALLDSEVDVAKLLAELKALGDEDVLSRGGRAGMEPGGGVARQRRARQLRSDAQSVRRPQRDSSRRSRKPQPVTAGGLGIAAGLALLGALAFLRAALQVDERRGRTAAGGVRSSLIGSCLHPWIHFQPWVSVILTTRE